MQNPAHAFEPDARLNVDAEIAAACAGLVQASSFWVASRTAQRENREPKVPRAKHGVHERLADR
eukprot:SAG11_NODE_25471_length_358_cov_0.992278_1_plen_63_part_10